MFIGHSVQTKHSSEHKQDKVSTVVEFACWWFRSNWNNNTSSRYLAGVCSSFIQSRGNLNTRCLPPAWSPVYTDFNPCLPLPDMSSPLSPHCFLTLKPNIGSHLAQGNLCSPRDTLLGTSNLNQASHPQLFSIGFQGHYKVKPVWPQM